ncbi:uncharacterized protein F5Z01DRAFT_678645 [Emericellopsis atlantica]|uniref:Uncharacterized protein n=1 Tax=Emericellopsis atlantica TaxID=2614577 RepID=A0A9P8CK13_9HYPO|nr:uncharacterized protein F5Z01DRAFT_678645 [Emericellopsis atlantica]KAG9249465.1 hypothetical protein F5Z01DRAFT_678645 [Emericellopsis atlantica]
MAEHPPIEAMQVSQETNSKRRHALSSMSESGRPVKCARISTVLLETPLLEDLSDAQTLEEDVSVTPQLKIEANLNPKRPRSLRPKKEQAPSKLKLMILEKPVYEASLGNNVKENEAEEERLRQAVEPTQWRTKRLARARLVPTMTATISGEYIPRVRQPKPPRHPTDSTSPSSSVTSGPLACSVSAASAGTDDFVEVNSRSRSRKVDYVLAIDCAATT